MPTVYNMKLELNEIHRINLIFDQNISNVDETKRKM